VGGCGKSYRLVLDAPVRAWRLSLGAAFEFNGTTMEDFLERSI
jgi:hypothetical protein